MENKNGSIDAYKKHSLKNLTRLDKIKLTNCLNKPTFLPQIGQPWVQLWKWRLKCKTYMQSWKYTFESCILKLPGIIKDATYFFYFLEI